MSGIRGRLTGTAIVLVLFGTSPLAGLAQTHDHTGNSAKELRTGIHHGKKLPVDSNLRGGMSRIRDAMAAEMAAISTGAMSEERYRTLARTVNDQVAFVIQNCRLDEEADATLHPILAELVAGAEEMSGASGEQSRHHGMERASRALEDYAESFEHPGWHGPE